jgi:dihydrofolate synthase/folylpolyglutamate synthase
LKPRQDWSLAEWLAWQEQLHPQAIDLGLERVRQVALRLGLLAPHVPTLSIAGTNGKGSSAALAALIYQEAGFRVGLYISPHLLRYNERVAINGKLAADEDLCRAFRAIDDQRQNISLTYFEFGTLAALWLYREADVQVRVLEVGLGGRLDAVNLVDADCALITNIGLDHTDWLGPDRESIGREKAGIMRSGRPAICAEETPPQSVIAAAKSLCARLAVLGADYRYVAHGNSWDWQQGERQLEHLPLPGLQGAAQLRNAAGVLTAIEVLQGILPVSEPAIRAALPKLSLPGRFQRQRNLILDVAHNVEAAAILADNLRAEAVSGRLILVLGMLRDKPVASFCQTLAPLVSQVHAAGLPPPRGLAAEQIALLTADLGWRIECHADVSAALAAAQAQAQPGDRILVTGSFLTVAAAYG